MKKLLYLLCLCTAPLLAQVQYGTPLKDEIPEELKKYSRELEVHHFPQEVHPIQIDKNYYWKHNTAVMSPQEPAEIVEFGAYVYYNNQWNLRKKYDLKEFDKLFGSKKRTLLATQPYTWNDNWRVGPQLFDGWALWYFIAKTKSGRTIIGFQSLYTSDQLIKS